MGKGGEEVDEKKEGEEKGKKNEENKEEKKNKNKKKGWGVVPKCSGLGWEMTVQAYHALMHSRYRGTIATCTY